MTAVDTWRELPGGEIEFTMKRLKSARANFVAAWMGCSGNRRISII
jgi:hypothetical protein